MRAISKDPKVPKILINEKRQATFEENKKLKHFPSGNTQYSVKSIKTELSIIYASKCAFCEDTLLNSAKHIEHYRPKNKNDKAIKCDASTSYFWLAFSWDNLLLACTKCNSSKGCCFEIVGTRADYEKDYADLSLAEVQDLITTLDETEKPLLVNPEQEEQSFFDEHLAFDMKTGEISSKNKRLAHTIHICNLKRDELNKLRLELINNLRNKINERKNDYRTHNNLKEYARDIANLRKDWQTKLKTNPKFSALYKYIDTHFKELLT